MDEGNVYKLEQYSAPPVWMEWLVYVCALVVFMSCVVFPTVWYAPAVLAGCLMYWNYRYFVLIRSYVSYVNHTRFKELLDVMKEAHNNKQKDGTFQDSSCLTKEHSDEGDS